MRRAALLLVLAACGVSPTASHQPCDAALRCPSDLTCTRNGCLAPAGDGEACASVSIWWPTNSNCTAGLVCYQDGVCWPLALGELGAVCSNDWECRSGICKGQAVCAGPGPGTLGEACGFEADCGPELTCENLVCFDALPDEAPCDYTPWACRDGSGCRGGRCGPL